MNAVDTNIWLYAIDRADLPKHQRAIDLITQLAGGVDTVIIWQVAAEFLSNLRKWRHAGRLSFADVELYLHKLLSMFPLVVPGRSQLDLSLALSTRHSLSYWDSLLLAARIEAGVTTLYSEDLSHEVAYDGVTVVNPFR